MIKPPAGAKVGERIVLTGADVPQDKQGVLNPKKKIAEKFLPLLATNEGCNACFNDIELLTSAGKITVPSLAKCNIS
jgi:hypothetical protein